MTEKIKYKQSQTIIINRTQINFAPYNPKHHTKDSVDQMKRNFKSVAFLGGIVWNESTGNLIDGHKRIQALDAINKYDGTPKTNYEVKVESINLDEKTEKEQNIFQTKSRTDLDDEAMRILIKDIDYKNAGLDEFDLNYYGVDIPEIQNTNVVEELEQLYKPVEQRKEEVKEVKKQIKEAQIEKAKDATSYITLSFDNHKNKEAFCQRFDIMDGINIVKGEEFSEKVERIYE